MDETTFEGNVSFDLSIEIKRHFSSSSPASSCATDKILNGNLDLLFVDVFEQNTKSPSEYYPLPFSLMVDRAHLLHCRRVLANVRDRTFSLLRLRVQNLGVEIGCCDTKLSVSLRDLIALSMLGSIPLG